MRAATITPTGVEKTLGQNELIVSKTDTKGVLTYVNGIFCRFAVADEADLIGKPHNIIRHPDMPRAVFKLMWEQISGGRELFAYVKNMGMDGSHYWVFAHVTPSYGPDGKLAGYHSNRRSPSREAIASIEPVYRRLCEIERSNSGSQEALSASCTEFNRTLTELDMSYDEFVWSITP